MWSASDPGALFLFPEKGDERALKRVNYFFTQLLVFLACFNAIHHDRNRHLLLLDVILRNKRFKGVFEKFQLISALDDSCASNVSNTTSFVKEFSCYV